MLESLRDLVGAWWGMRVPEEIISCTSTSASSREVMLLICMATMQLMALLPAMTFSEFMAMNILKNTPMSDGVISRAGAEMRMKAESGISSRELTHCADLVLENALEISSARIDGKNCSLNFCCSSS